MTSRILNPETALAEKDASGSVAEIFAEIREVMEIPMITSLWRILVNIEDGLDNTWRAARILYQTGQPQAALLKITKDVAFPAPDALFPDELADAGVAPKDLKMALSIVRAYNRSNGLNFVVLHSLLESPKGEAADRAISATCEPWHAIPPLQEIADMNQITRLRLSRFRDLIVLPGISGVPTVWRHLSHWPALLDLIYTSIKPLVKNGSIESAMGQILTMAKEEGAHIAHLRPPIDSIPPVAMDFIRIYAHEVHQVITMCNGIQLWLEKTIRNEEELKK